MCLQVIVPGLLFLTSRKNCFTFCINALFAFGLVTPSAECAVRTAHQRAVPRAGAPVVGAVLGTSRSGRSAWPAISASLGPEFAPAAGRAPTRRPDGQRAAAEPQLDQQTAGPFRLLLPIPAQRLLTDTSAAR